MAQISMKYLFSFVNFYFDLALCWFGYFLYQINEGIKIDFDLRNHQTIIFCTIGVFFGKIILMFVEYEKKGIEVEQKKVDLQRSIEDLRTVKIKNNIDEANFMKTLISLDLETDNHT